MLTLALAGDVMLGRGVSKAFRRLRDPAEPWGDVLPLLHQADVRLVNLECALTDHVHRWTGGPKLFYFRADPAPALAVLKAARVDACALANNHVFDFEETGLLDTLRHLDGAGITHAGAGRDLGEAMAPALLGGVAMLSFTDNEPAFAAGEERPGTFFLPISLERVVLRQLEEAIGRAGEGGRLVVLSAHWGPNFVERPSSLFRSFARAAIDRGAHVFFGHSAHLCQGVELYRGRPILYDTGDLIDDYAVDGELRNDWSFLFHLSFEADRLAGLELWPLSLGYAHVSLASSGDRAAMLSRMRRLSDELGTSLVARAGRLVLEVPSAAVVPSAP